MPGDGAHRSVPTPVRRGVAVVVVAGGALSLVGATSTDLLSAVGPIGVPTLDAGVTTAALLPASVAVPAQAATAALLVPTVQPVAAAPEVLDAALDAAELVKAVQLAEEESARLAAENAAREERAAQEKARAEKQAVATRAEDDVVAVAASGSPGCGLDTSNLGSVKSHVREAADFLGCLFGEPTVLGVAGRAGTSDHPSGKALDFMVDRSTGDGLAACALRNQDALGITYVIWQQQINHGSGWEPMEDRGSATANHRDHVHVSFGPGAGNGDTDRC